jgi:hypothetical protein
MVVFLSEFEYITSVATLADRLARVRALILALMDAQLKAALTGNISEYSLDDGQTKIKTVNRSPKELATTITELERQEQTLMRQLNKTGYVRLVDGKNFIGNRWG